jgi:hypothetical protein
LLQRLEEESTQLLRAATATCDCLRRAMATATRDSREMTGMIRRPSAWIQRGERGGQQGGIKIRSGSQSSVCIYTGLEEGLEPNHLDVVEMGGRSNLRRRRAGARWLGRDGEERERRGHTCWFGVERGEAKCERVGRINRAPGCGNFLCGKGGVRTPKIMARLTLIHHPNTCRTCGGTSKVRL